MSYNFRRPASGQVRRTFFYFRIQLLETIVQARQLPITRPLSRDEKITYTLGRFRKLALSVRRRRCAVTLVGTRALVYRENVRRPICTVDARNLKIMYFARSTLSSSRFVTEYDSIMFDAATNCREPRAGPGRWRQLAVPYNSARATYQFRGSRPARADAIT